MPLTCVDQHFAQGIKFLAIASADPSLRSYAFKFSSISPSHSHRSLCLVLDLSNMQAGTSRMVLGSSAVPKSARAIDTVDHHGVVTNAKLRRSFTAPFIPHPSPASTFKTKSSTDSSPTTRAARTTTHVVRASASSASTSNNLPLQPVHMVDQAATCVSAALDQNQLRQQIDVLLPVNEKERRFTATEPMDYPCSLQKEFDCACSLTKSLLQRVLGDANANINAKRLDDGGVEGEPCAVMYPSDTKSIAAVVFPTAERLQQIQSLAKDASRPLLIVNPQWRDDGNVVSDFGFFWQRNAAIEFLSAFVPTYSLKEKRIGSPGTINTATGTRFTNGGVVRVLRRWPEPYECYAVAADGSSQLLQIVQNEPKYNELDAMIKQGRQQKLEIFKLAMKATDIYAELARSSDEVGVNEDEVANESSVVGDGSIENREMTDLSDADVDALDAASLRRLLMAAGQPASGKISKLRERLKEFMASTKVA
jgi:hypothetical protein